MEARDRQLLVPLVDTCLLGRPRFLAVSITVRVGNQLNTACVSSWPDDRVLQRRLTRSGRQLAYSSM